MAHELWGSERIAQRMAIVEKYEVLILDLSEVPRMGVTASLAVETMNPGCPRSGTGSVFSGGHGPGARSPEEIRSVKVAATRNRVTNRLDALQQAIAFIQQRKA